MDDGVQRHALGLFERLVDIERHRQQRGVGCLLVGNVQALGDFALRPQVERRVRAPQPVEAILARLLVSSARSTPRDCTAWQKRTD